MMMAACYANYDLHGLPSQQQHHQHLHHHHQQQQHHAHQLLNAITVAATSAAAVGISTSSQQQQQQQQQQQKDYSIPLHVDCSVEYELPNQPKPPSSGRIEPLLMIHPCYFRKMESQRRSPFINNMPNSSRVNAMLALQAANYPLVTTTATSSVNLQNQTADYNAKERRVGVIQQTRNSQQQQQTTIINSQKLINKNWDKISTINLATLPSKSTLYNSNNHNNSNSNNNMKIGVGKRDAMISGSCSSSLLSSSNSTHSTRSNSNINRNNLLNSSSAAVSSSTLLDAATTLKLWDSRTSTLIQNSPMAAVPSNSSNSSYQAGPEHQSQLSVNSSQQATLIDDKLNSKYRQYLRSQRIHPYLMQTTTNTTLGTTAAVCSQLPSSAFTHQMQQMRCYDV